MHENKWKHGKVLIELPRLPHEVLSSTGIKPISVILDTSVGPEIVLLITESKPHIEEFEGRSITGFWIKSGLVNTSYGPVYWLLFYFPSPQGNGKVTYENVVNPKDTNHLSIYEALANQEYWHVIMADESGKVVNFFEFKNNYGLAESLRQVTNVCASLNISNFMAAKQEYENSYSIEDLLDA
jgi:hypothetical protein